MNSSIKWRPVSFLFAVEFKVKVVIERVRPDGIPTTNAPSQLGEEGESSQQENNQTQGDESEKALCRTNFTLKEKEDLCSNDLQSQTSEEGYFQCTRCNESFFSRGNLTRHIRVHNKGTEKCEDCGALFTHKATLSKHIKKMHNGEPWTKRLPLWSSLYGTLNLLAYFSVCVFCLPRRML